MDQAERIADDGAAGSLRALLNGVVDYAGLFPPAKLPLDDAIRNYARYRHEPEHWMLGRFICAAARLRELDAYVDQLFDVGPPLRAAALLKPVGNLDELAVDCRIVDAFCEAHPGRVVVDVAELRLLDPEISLADVVDVIEGALACPVTVFIEVANNDDWRTTSSPMIDAIALLNETTSTYRNVRHVGFKLRCGGESAETFPSSSQVASILNKCRDVGVPLKFTAGLHHPLRHRNESLRTKMHGFLNLFAGGVVSHVHHLTNEDLSAILEDESANVVRFAEATLTCHRWSIGTADVARLREQSVTSFGSCSFDEPRDDLRSLGLAR